MVLFSPYLLGPSTAPARPTTFPAPILLSSKPRMSGGGQLCTGTLMYKYRWPSRRSDRSTLDTPYGSQTFDLSLKGLWTVLRPEITQNIYQTCNSQKGLTVKTTFITDKTVLSLSGLKLEVPVRYKSK